MWLTAILWVAPVTAGSLPVRIAVNPDEASVRAGSSVEVKVELRDAFDKDANTPKDLKIAFTFGVDGGGVKRLDLTIKAGTDSAKVKIPLSAPGVYLLKAAHPYLREGAAYVRVKPASSVLKRSWNPYGTNPFVLANYQPVRSGTIKAQLYYTGDESKLIANGVEKCKIIAYLSEPAPFDIQLRLVSPFANVTPNPIVISIDKDEDEATAELASTVAGDIQLQFVGSRPSDAVMVTRGGEKIVHFAPPISQIRLTLSPPKIMLGRTTGVAVELTDDRDKPTATERELEVALSIDDGHGDFESRTVKIPSGSHGASTNFTPSASGRIKLSARTFGAVTKTPATLDVSMPVLAMILTIIAGLVGGLLAAVRTPPLSGWRIAYSSLGGIVAAFLLYAAAQTGLVPKLPPPATVNFFGATMIGLLGGWIGAEAFNTVLKLAGLPVRQTA
ncbi:MAG TPA: hypothetical protein VEX68_30780 [Bryobacteraceae bacterium]|nr:hypothetical protein [Bryobacteraceae bacterium]